MGIRHQYASEQCRTAIPTTVRDTPMAATSRSSLCSRQKSDECTQRDQAGVKTVWAGGILSNETTCGMYNQMDNEAVWWCLANAELIESRTPPTQGCGKL